jgi:predicted SprT family Zn-dependent metalloprotease
MTIPKKIIFIFMKLMSLLNEIKEHTDEEIVDFNEIDLRHEFDKLNKLLFNNKLYAPQMLWNTRKGAHGVVKASKNRSTGEIKIISLSMSKFHTIPYKFFKDVLAHEMIHVYWLEKGHFKEQHGSLFQQEMYRINSLDYGFNVTIKGDSSNYGISQEVVKQGLELVFTIISTDRQREKMLSVMTYQTYKNEAKLIGNLYQNLAKKKFSQVQGEFYKSTNPILQKYKIQRSFGRSISYSNIDEQKYEELKRDATFLSDFNLTDKSTQPDWNGSDLPNEPIQKQKNVRDNWFNL